MKRLFTAVFILAVMTLNAYGATVFVETVESRKYDELPEDDKKALSLLENGVMDRLFEEGHIIFSSYSLSTQESRENFGADYILKIVPAWESHEVHYQFLSGANGSILSEGTITADDVSSDDTLNEEQVYYQMGIMISEIPFSSINP